MSDWVQMHLQSVILCAVRARTINLILNYFPFCWDRAHHNMYKHEMERQFAQYDHVGDQQLKLLRTSSRRLCGSAWICVCDVESSKLQVVPHSSARRRAEKASLD